LQDHRRRDRVDRFLRNAAPAFAAGAFTPQAFLGILRGPAFIDEVDG